MNAWKDFMIAPHPITAKIKKGLGLVLAPQISLEMGEDQMQEMRMVVEQSHAR